MQKKLLSTERYKGYSYIFESRYSSDPVELRDYLNPIDVDKFVEGTAGEKFFQARARARRAAAAKGEAAADAGAESACGRRADESQGAWSRATPAERSRHVGSVRFPPPPRGNVFAGHGVCVRPELAADGVRRVGSGRLCKPRRSSSSGEPRHFIFN